MNKPSSTPRRASAAAHLRQEIEKAEADGVSRASMTLKLTYGDVHQLKRDPDLPLTDISFADGVMRFLGVKVEQGGVAESSLQRPDPG
jgi:hypothetical protein